MSVKCVSKKSDPRHAEKSASKDESGPASVEDEMESTAPQVVTGYASRFHFYPKNTSREVDKYPWFLGENCESVLFTFNERTLFL